MRLLNNAPGFSTLTNESLRGHWSAIHSKLIPDAPYLGREPKLSHRLDLAATNLPYIWLARQMGWGPVYGGEEDGDRDQLIRRALHGQVMLSAVARLERSNASQSDAESRMPSVMEQEWRKIRVPVALALPGVASGYVRRAYTASERQRIEPMPAADGSDTWSAVPENRSDVSLERSAIEFITTHRAVARSGIGLCFQRLSRKHSIYWGNSKSTFDPGQTDLRFGGCWKS